MLYHDPELCAFLDTKKISPDSYAHLWFRSLFAANSNLQVILNLWDMYFQLGDQFLIFFMSLILLFNIRDEIMAAGDMDRAELTKMILSSPLSLNVDDLMDFNTLCQHFAAKTPQSFRKEYKKPLFEGVALEKKASKIYQALCLPVSVDELLQANQLGSGVRYFIIDCRPAEKYNASHYATAFHLDANLMLENPSEFNQSVEGLLAAQKQAIDAGSVAGGQHLCFMGSGNDEEDKYVNMVVSNFLQRKINFVSLALGGYEELKNVIEDPEMIVGTNVHNSRYKFTEEWVKKLNASQSSTSMLNKFSSVFKTKSFDIKDKLKDYINNSLTVSNPSMDSNSKKTDVNKKQSTKHVSATDKIGKLYRNQGNLFAIDDSNAEDSPADTAVENVNLKVWLEKPDVLHKFKCFYREKREGSKLEWIPGYLLLTKTHLYGLTQPSNGKNGMAQISVRHHLNSIIKIATKSHCPEIISFTYGEKIAKSSFSKKAPSQESTTEDKLEQTKEEASVSNNEADSKSQDIPEYDIKGKEWFYVPDYAGEAASAVKLQILEIVDLTSH
ncbi:unnamed protein product [Brachionus calyciflorus]|uniref:TBC1 domain family member 23 n=1 Tax=Brachionus calyciflorus TaxID=104777 RepID=A0A814ICQ9_9BILA|nr:unnamed protein product [Brachionus calyciflorus]